MKKARAQKQKKRWSKKAILGAIVLTVMAISVVALVLVMTPPSGTPAVEPNAYNLFLTNGGRAVIETFHKGESGATLNVTSLTYRPPTELYGNLTVFSIENTTSTPIDTREVNYSSGVLYMSNTSTTDSIIVSHPADVFSSMMVHEIYEIGGWQNGTTHSLSGGMSMVFYPLNPQFPPVSTILVEHSMYDPNLSYYFAAFVYNKVTVGIDFQVRYSNEIIYEENAIVTDVFGATTHSSMTSTG